MNKKTGYSSHKFIVCCLMCLIFVMQNVPLAFGSEINKDDPDFGCMGHILFDSNQYLSEGTDLTFVPVFDNQDFYSIYIRNIPEGHSKSFLESMDQTYYYIIFMNSDGTLFFEQRMPQNGDYTGENGPPLVKNVTYEVLDDQTTKFHITYEETNYSVGKNKWTFEVLYLAIDGFFYNMGKFKLHFFDRGVSIPDTEELEGGWKFESASDGNTYDDFYFSSREIQFRRHDAKGGIYYAPRRYRKENRFIISDHFTWTFLNDNGRYVFTDSNGVKMYYQKTNETEKDFQLSTMGEGTPLFVKLFNQFFQEYDDDFNAPDLSGVIFYEDVVVSGVSLNSDYENVDIKYTTSVRYEDNRIYIPADGSEGYYEWNLDGSYLPYLSRTVYDAEGNRLYESPKMRDFSGHAFVPQDTPIPEGYVTPEPTPSPTPSPTPEPTPEPLPSIGFGAEAPNSSMASYSEFYNPSFHISLNSDGTGTLHEVYMEESVFSDITWYWEGNALYTTDSVGIYQKTVFHNGKGVYQFFDAPVEIKLPENAASFFQTALGYVPDGVTEQPEEKKTPAPSTGDAKGENQVSEPIPTQQSGNTASPKEEPSTEPEQTQQSGNNIVVKEIPSDNSDFSGNTNSGSGTAGNEGENETQTTSALRDIPGNPGKKQVPVSAATSSSHIIGKNGPGTYAPDKMIDGVEETAFQFSTKTTRLGKAYVSFTFSTPVTFDELWIKNGFWRYSDGKDQYTRNSRVKVMTVEYLYEGQSEYTDIKKITLKDDKKRKDWTKIELGRKENVTGVRFCIQKIYNGSKYKKDVCISEVMFVKNDD